MLAAATWLFVDTSGIAAAHLNWIAKIQFLPALMAGSIITVIVLLVATLLLGRVYCSVICPLGLLQDLIARVGRAAKKNRYTYSKAKNILRWGVLGVTVIAFVAGIGSVVALVAPYSSFGRIAQTLLAPLSEWGNNIAAQIAESNGSYAVSETEIWVRSIPTLVIAALTLVGIGIVAWMNGRTYCNTICPVGTVLGFLSKYSLMAPVIDKSKCISCRKCERNCKAACIDIAGTKEIDGSRCVTCMNCIDTCPKGAISYTMRNRTAKVEAEGGETPSGRRMFLTMLGLTAASVASAKKDKLVDGGLTVIEDKEPMKRETPLVPPGAESLRNFRRHCTGCQLCVAKCPNGVLRPSTDLGSLMQPVMSYENGYCRQECTRCSEVCPAGAIKPYEEGAKSSIQIGHAVWVKERCVVLTDEVSCGTCARHCPVGAISMVKYDAGDGKEVRIPAVNEERCIGCGACENLCPSRPLSAIYVEGHENHKIL